jgi:3-oxoacyl-(acyl-carrier-protein) synthase
MLPANLGGDPLDAELPIAVETRTRPLAIGHALSNSFGFAGSNCALVFARA